MTSHLRLCAAFGALLGLTACEAQPEIDKRAVVDDLVTLSTEDIGAANVYQELTFRFFSFYAPLRPEDAEELGDWLNEDWRRERIDQYFASYEVDMEAFVLDGVASNVSDEDAALLAPLLDDEAASALLACVSSSGDAEADANWEGCGSGEVASVTGTERAAYARFGSALQSLLATDESYALLGGTMCVMLQDYLAQRRESDPNFFLMNATINFADGPERECEELVPMLEEQYGIPSISTLATSDEEAGG